MSQSIKRGFQRDFNKGETRVLVKLTNTPFLVKMTKENLSVRQN